MGAGRQLTKAGQGWHGRGWGRTWMHDLTMGTLLTRSTAQDPKKVKKAPAAVVGQRIHEASLSPVSSLHAEASERPCSPDP